MKKKLLIYISFLVPLLFLFSCSKEFFENPYLLSFKYPPFSCFDVGFTDSEAGNHFKNPCGFDFDYKPQHIEPLPIEEIDINKSHIGIYVLDVGQGDSILIIFPNGKVMLIDGGTGSYEYSRVDMGEKVVIPFLRALKIERINCMILTHPHFDHLGGLLSVLLKYEVDRVFEPGFDDNLNDAYSDFIDQILTKKVIYKNPSAGDTIFIDPECFIKVLHPGKARLETANNSSIVIEIDYNKFRMLFTGDAETESECEIMQRHYLHPVTLLKVPHHGSDTSSNPLFIKILEPQCAIVSVGKNNRFGLPCQKTMDFYENAGIRIYRTDFDGTVKILSDGLKFNISSEKIQKQ